jgi:phosphomannomutase
MDAKIFKAYDIRGIYPDEINAEDGYKISRAYSEIIKPKGKVAVGWDVRLYSEEISQKVIEGLIDSGIDVLSIGLVSTEILYFAVGYLNLSGGIQITASHNPAQYHGLKLVREKVKPISIDNGMEEIKNLSLAGKFESTVKKGNVTSLDIIDEYIQFILRFVDKSIFRKTKIVYNPNFGYQGKVFERLVRFANLPFEIIPLNAEPDGSFPKGQPDPMISENRNELIELVKSSQADLAVAWDADADRVFFCADKGLFIEPYYTNLLLIEQLLKKHPREKVLYDPRLYWATIDVIKRFNGVPVLGRVGHSFIKALMRSENAVFSGETSGHCYFRDFWYADNGLIPLLLVLEILSKSGKKLSELIEPYQIQYPISNEINVPVADTEKIFGQIGKKYQDAKISRFDGISVEYPDWRLNIRASKTEPLLRLNLEGKSKEIIQQKTKEIFGLI